jgi:site-specific DNA-methyltransferase (adenine-specific)
MYKLIHGDCLEEMDRIESGSVDMILADLPYQTTACEWDLSIPLISLWSQYKRVIKASGVIALTSDEPFTSILIMNDLQLFKYKWIWKKTRPTGFLDANEKPLDDYEEVIIFYSIQPTYNPQRWKGNPNHVKHGKGVLINRSKIYNGKNREIVMYQTEDKYPRKVIEIPSLNPAQKSLHPTQKPVALLSYLIKTYTNEGETVLDNTMGSGSTGEACLVTNRQFIGIELDKSYFDIATQRLARVAAELRGEYMPKVATKMLDDLPMFKGLK